MNQKHVIFIFVVALFLFFSFSSCCHKLREDSMKVLGPRDKPDFKSMNWEGIDISYWIRPNKRYKKKKTLKIREKKTINEIKEVLLIKKVGPMSVGSGEQLVITLKNGEQWQGNIVFEDELHLCKKADNYYSYYLELSNKDFHNKILKLCLENERKKHPQVTERHIILLPNMDIEYYKILNK